MIENEKICPIMSQPVAVPHQSGIVMHYELCQKERCMAWGKKLEPRENIESPVIWIDGCRLIP